MVAAARMFCPGQGHFRSALPARRPRFPGAGPNRAWRPIGLGQDLWLARQLIKSVDTTQTCSFGGHEAAVDAAHAKQRPVGHSFVWTVGREDASRAGSDSIDDGSDLDDETIADMVGAVRSGCRPSITTGTMSKRRASSASRRHDSAPAGLYREDLESTRRAFKAGREACDGLRRGLQHVRKNTRELAGSSSRDDARTGARHGDDDPAALLGTDRDLARSPPGYFADIVAVDGESAGYVNVLITGVRWVMKRRRGWS